MNNLFQDCSGPVGPKGEKGDQGLIGPTPDISHIENQLNNTSSKPVGYYTGISQKSYLYNSTVDADLYK